MTCIACILAFLQSPKQVKPSNNYLSWIYISYIIGITHEYTCELYDFIQLWVSHAMRVKTWAKLGPVPIPLPGQLQWWDMTKINTFYHRDRSSIPDAGALKPDQVW